jgi:copper(I)-binding protein
MRYKTILPLMLFLGINFPGFLNIAIANTTDAETNKAPAPVSRVKAYEAKVMIPLAGVQLPQVFVRLQNTGDKPVSLVKVTTAMAERVVIMQVKPAKPGEFKNIPSLLLPAKTLVDLHKAGPYLLLEGLKAPLQTGDQLHIKLSFSDNTQLEVTAIAKSAFDQPHHH